MKITQNRSRILCNNNGYESASNKMHSYLKSGKYKDRIKLIDEVTPDSGYSPYYILMVYSPDMQPSGYIRYSKNKLVYQIYNSIGQASKVDTLRRCLSRFESAIEVFDDFDKYNDSVNSATNNSNIMSPVGKVNSKTSKLNYTTPDMKNLKRAISRIIVDNDEQFIDLIDAILSGKPINEVSEVRALHRAIDQCVVDSDEQLRDLILQVAADIGVISESSYLNDKSIHSSTSTNSDSDSLVWM